MGDGQLPSNRRGGRSRDAVRFPDLLDALLDLIQSLLPVIDGDLITTNLSQLDLGP
jgi:hypothetical protein